VTVHAMPESIAVITTPAALRGPAIAHEAVRLLREAGRDPLLHIATEPGRIVEYARAAALDGKDTVIAVGGDGTVRDVVTGLLRAGADGRLGIIPAGTGDAIARHLRLPRSLPVAVAVVLRGKERRIDLGEVNGVPFLGLVVLGFAAEVGRVVNALKSGPARVAARRLRGRLYHVVAFQRMLCRPEVLRYGLMCDGAARDVEVFTVMVGNLPGTGGVFLPCPDADVCDGKLDVCVIAARRPDGQALGLRDKARTLRMAVTGVHVTLPWVEVLQASSELRVRLSLPRVVLADGDALPPADEIVVRPLPGALRVLI